MDSRPAIIRSAVVFPQPDGPTNTTNSPLATSRSRSETACVPSGYTLVRLSRVISATSVSEAAIYKRLEVACASPQACVRTTCFEPLTSPGPYGGPRCAVETGWTSLAARSREPPYPRAASHRPGGHLHGARGGRPVRVGDLPQLHGRDRRLADRQLGRLRQLHERLAGRELPACRPEHAHLHARLAGDRPRGRRRPLELPRPRLPRASGSSASSSSCRGRRRSSSRRSDGCGSSTRSTASSTGRSLASTSTTRSSGCSAP